ncbi:hypothetical protein [Psychroserpens sp. Hel_I_66]|uniref:hypothetical protein n=1 Tax=Psychroserpens sp. Hel_I_66 TaxID=1250004 RepID=UPI0006477715|nr:hypothetical protein [Psychroserpens sp. Hel_I_66]
MKKLILTFAFLFTLATVFTSCREEKTPDEKVEEAMDDVKEDLEDASDDVQDAAEDLQEEVEEAAEEANDDN